MNEQELEESVEKIYQDSLEKQYWLDAKELYPNYNNNGDQTADAVDYIVGKIIDDNNLEDSDGQLIINKLYDKVWAGLT